MTGRRQGLGARGEALARAHLERAGYVVRATNHRNRRGETDIIADHEGCLVFVEVRTRRGAGFGTPEESIGPRKARRLVALAQEYAADHPEAPQNLRIDVVAVALTSAGSLARIEVVQNAVTDQT